MLPPGPKGKSLSFLINISGKRRMDWMNELYKKYGDIVHLKILGINIIVINHPKYAKHALNNIDIYGKHSAVYYALRTVIGKGLFTSEGELWKTQRRTMQPYFHKAYMEVITHSMVSRIDKQLNQLAQEIQTDEKVNIVHWMNRITLDITIYCLFGVSIATEKIDKIIKIVNSLLKDIQRIALSPGIIEKLPTYANYKFYKNLKELDEIVSEIIEERSKKENPGDDFFSLLLGTDENGKPIMTPEQIQEEVTTFLLTGFETTAHALSWSWKLLFASKDILKKTQSIVDNTLPAHELPTMSDYKALSAISDIFNETLRLYPNMPILSRRTRTNDKIGEFDIPKNSEVFINTFILQKRKDQWEHPEEFIPNRFSKNSNHKDWHPFSFLPWGGGPRKCIGYHFSHIEAVFIMSMILKRFEVDLIDEKTKNKLTVMLRPSKVTLRMKEKVEQNIII